MREILSIAFCLQPVESKGVGRGRVVAIWVRVGQPYIGTNGRPRYLQRRARCDGRCRCVTGLGPSRHVPLPTAADHCRKRPPRADPAHPSTLPGVLRQVWTPRPLTSAPPRPTLCSWTGRSSSTCCRACRSPPSPAPSLRWAPTSTSRPTPTVAASARCRLVLATYSSLAGQLWRVQHLRLD